MKYRRNNDFEPRAGSSSIILKLNHGVSGVRSRGTEEVTMYQICKMWSFYLIFMILVNQMYGRLN